MIYEDQVCEGIRFKSVVFATFCVLSLPRGHDVHDLVSVNYERFKSRRKRVRNVQKPPWLSDF